MSVSIGIRMPDETKNELDKIASAAGVTRNVVVQIAVDEISRGNYRLDGDHLVPTDEYLDAIRPEAESMDFEFEELGFGAVLRRLRDKKYPDSAIKQMMGQFLMQINENGNYNPRRGTDWGA